jgi:large subunit ribosomal protein L16
MLLLPKRTKWRRQHRGRIKGFSSASSLGFGDYGLQALEAGWVTARQIEATRRSIIRYVRRTGRIWIRIFPDKPITVRPPESRMGSGKGKVSYWVCVVRPRAVLFEINGLAQKKARAVLTLASFKLPIKVKFIGREEEI